ncbi:MAG: calcium-binding protein [Actinomycetota bacterium]
MRFRTIAVAVATTAMMVGPAFVHGALSSVAGAKKECTITGTAADDDLTGTTRDDVICTKAGADSASGGEGNDIIRGGQGDDNALEGEDGSDVVKGQADDDTVEGEDQNDELYGGQGDDNVGENYQPVGEGGNDFLKSRDNVSGNDQVYPDPGTDTCSIDAGDTINGTCDL